MDHLLHMFHHGQVYFMILTVRFTWSLCYCGTPSTHDFSSSTNSLSSLFPFLYLSIFSLFQIFIKSTSSSFLHHLHHIFILPSSSSSTYSSSSWEEKKQENKKQNVDQIAFWWLLEGIMRLPKIIKKSALHSDLLHC